MFGDAPAFQGLFKMNTQLLTGSPRVTKQPQLLTAEKKQLLSQGPGRGMETPSMSSRELLQANPCGNIRKPCWGRAHRQTSLALREQGIAICLCLPLFSLILLCFV